MTTTRSPEVNGSGIGVTNVAAGDYALYLVASSTNLSITPKIKTFGLHVGNLFAFTGNDIHGRFQRMQGHTVFEPFGYDAFGIHSENYALKVGENPMDLIPTA